MKSVVLSTTEAEYMALSEVVKELKLIVKLVQTMNIEEELPITVHMDNVGAIWLSNNRNTGDRTKHMDIRTSFVKEYQEDGKIIIKFMKSEVNEADILKEYNKHHSSKTPRETSLGQERSECRKITNKSNQNMKSTGRMLKSKSEQDRQTDIPTKI